MMTEILNRPWKETLEVAYDAYVKQAEIAASEQLKMYELHELVKSICDHPHQEITEVYYSGSYYDQAHTEKKTECKVCGNITYKDTGWRGGYG